ncbi:hypothetical protein Dimus_037928 [Dionaea muscipula]
MTSRSSSMQKLPCRRGPVMDLPRSKRRSSSWWDEVVSIQMRNPFEEVDDFTLVGKLKDENQQCIFPHEVEAELRQAWNLVGSASMNMRVCYEDGTGDPRFIFYFEKERHYQRALHGGPWYVLGAFLAVQRLSPNEVPEKGLFDKVPIWFRVTGLPLKFYNVEVGKLMGRMVGDLKAVHVGYKDYDTAVEELGIRVQVAVDVEAPVFAGVFVMVSELDQDPIWVTFRYEKVEKLCFNCGFIGHRFVNCSMPLAMAELQYDRRIAERAPDEVYLFDSESYLYTMKNQVPSARKRRMVQIRQGILACPGLPLGRKDCEQEEEEERLLSTVETMATMAKEKNNEPEDEENKGSEEEEEEEEKEDEDEEEEEEG